MERIEIAAVIQRNLHMKQTGTTTAMYNAGIVFCNPAMFSQTHVAPFTNMV